MRISAISGVLGALLLMFSFAFVFAIAVALMYAENTVDEFSICFGISLVVGLICFFLRKRGSELRARDAFLVVALCYLSLGLLGAVPFWLLAGTNTSFADAAFESFSGITTTGATVLTGLDSLPKSLLIYRQLLQWIGGMGIIVLAIAILPMLGVGGMQLYKAEAPGSEREMSLQLRVRDTAGALWAVYLGLTILCALAYWAAGMTIFDAVSHSFSTVAIGGFSTHDQSIGFFQSPAIETIAIVFMLLAGVNFMIHYIAIHPRGNVSAIRNFIRAYAKDGEVRLYFGIVALVAVIVSLNLIAADGFSTDLLRKGIFQSVSFATTTGFTTSSFDGWPLICPVLLIFAAFAGGCTGSTAGGIKVYRILLLVRQGVREIRQLIQPGAIFHVRIDGRLVEDRLLETVWGFLAVYAACFVFLLCMLLFLGDLDFKSAFAAIAATLNNLGPGLGEVATNYQGLSAAEKILLMVSMVLGRLEIFTILVLLAPRYWRR